MRLRERLFPHPRGSILVLLLALLAMLPAIAMWHWVSTHWVSVPYWDEWQTPGSQFVSWARGTLSWAEMFSQHNESRKFFPRLLYFALEHFGGWDVRKEMRVLFFLVCGLCLLLLHLLRRTPGATPVGTLLGWSVMTFFCFAPVQIGNFLYGIQLETFLPGVAVVLVAAINLSRLSLRSKTLCNSLVAFVASYTFANGLLLWALAWPFPAPNDSTSRGVRRLCSALYAVAGAGAIVAYFIGYQRPPDVPPLVFDLTHLLELAHYFVLWEGNYLNSTLARPFLLGMIALGLLSGGIVYALVTIRRRGDWRTFYPWLLLAAYAVASGLITAVGRLGFGVEQALSYRYAAFTLSFYLALVGLFFAIYCSRVRTAPRTARITFLVAGASLVALTTVCWSGSLMDRCEQLAIDYAARERCRRTLEWMEPIPDNPDLRLVLPDAELLKKRVRFLEEHRILRLPFVHGALAAAVQAPPASADGAHGRIEASDFDAQGQLQVKGWAFLPEGNRRADCVVIGSENAAGIFKPMSVLETGAARPDLREKTHNPRFSRAGFGRAINPANILPGKVTIKGYAIDLRRQKAWPLVE